MARKSSKKQRRRLLPEALSNALKRLIVKIFSIGVIASSIAFIAALTTYSAKDPSLNTKVTEEGYQIINAIGLPGAFISDLFIQTLGLASFALPLVMFCWGIVLFKKQTVSRWWVRLISTLIGAISLSTALAHLPLSLTRTPYGGGSLGLILTNQIVNPLREMGVPYAFWIVTTLSAIIGLFLVMLATGVKKEQWVSLYSHTIQLLKMGTDRIANAFYWTTDHIKDLYTHLKGKNQSVEKPARAKRKTAVASKPKKKSTPSVKQSKTALPRGKREAEEQQSDFDFMSGQDYIFPPLSLLQDPDDTENVEMPASALEKNAELLQSVLEDFGIEGEIVAVNPGPVVTLYELEPAPGIKSSRIISLSDDIARSMAAVSVRIAVIPGRKVIGIELPNSNRQTVYLRELLASKVYEDNSSNLGLVLGKNISGDPIIADLAKMPHLLIAGTTGSGKSVGINAMILSILYKMRPEECRMIMIDPKMLELSVYDGIPHLLTPVVTSPKKAIVALKWAVREMEDRYRAMSKLGVRNIEGYNEKIKKARKKGEILTRKVQTGFDPDSGKPVFEEEQMDMSDLPYIVVVVDEFADLMLVAGKEVEAAIQRLAQMARAAGIHLIMATQRPSVDVITGTVKANFPSRISFQVTSRIDSRTILGDTGAEHLLGKGDMLYMAGGGKINRVHGPFVDDDEVEEIVAHLKQQGEPQYIESVTDESSQEFADGSVGDALFGSDDDTDELFDQAVEIVARSQRASTSYLQRQLSIGYNRAARMIDQMEEHGMIGSPDHVGRREVNLRKPDDMDKAS